MNGRYEFICVDIETCSAADISDGAWPYSLHPSTRVWCVVFGLAARDGEDVPTRIVEWIPGQHLPADLYGLLRHNNLPLVAHNCGFERAIWSNVLAPRHGFPSVPPDEWLDTQAEGLALNLPASLDGLARALGCDAQKDEEGSDLMKSLAHVEPIKGGSSWEYPRPSPADLERLVLYCRRDVEATIECHRRMPALSPTEELVWRADQRCNARGAFIDGELVASFSAAVEERRKRLDMQAFSLTGGELANATAAPALKAWLRGLDVKLPRVKRKRADGSTATSETIDKATIAHLVDDPNVREEARAVLRNRQEAAKAASLTKLKRAAMMVASDGRLRDALQYCGALTGRWTSYGVQFHNLPKNKLGASGSELALRLIESGDLEGLEAFFDRPLEAISQSLRSIVSAPPGRELIAADYSAVEARVIAWLAGQEDVLAVFRSGRDVYVKAAEDIGSDSRALGKVCVLALGYGMGDVKFAATANAVGVELSLREARRVKNAWRRANDRIVTFWQELEDAARSALDAPGKMFPAGRVNFRLAGPCLLMRLPSGRSIRYWRPSQQWVRKRIEVVDEDGNVKEVEMETLELRFFKMAKNRRSMDSESTYGGKLAENATQAVARDLLAEALIRVDATPPYKPVIHVHDSLAAEVPRGEGSVDEFCDLMARSPRWARGLPIAVEGYRSRRFRG